MNLKNFKIVKTGIVFLSTDQKGESVYINGELQDRKTPYAENLTPGQYTAEVTKDGYRSWYQGFKIDPAIVTSFDSIVLFKSDPVISDLTDQRKIDLLNSPVDYLAVSNDKNSLTYGNYEIWQNNFLVTRFSESIQNVSWYPDMEHIVYQQGDEIKIIEKDGYNNTPLVKLLNSDPVNFVVNSRGDELYYTDGGQYKMAKIK